MNPREQRGLELAKAAKITQHGEAWQVPSQSGNKKRYRVRLDGEFPRCTCPDFEFRGQRCKHIHAVEYTLKQETTADGTTTVTETVKVTYGQNWPAYNTAQTNEKARFMVLLAGLCQGIPEPPQGLGRPRVSLRDVVFSAAFKVYSTVSTRRCMSDLQDAHAKGYISKAPHYNTIIKYLELPDLTPILRDLIVVSSLPLKAVETDFAVDASGFSSSRFVRWYDAAYGPQQDRHDWLKVHLMVGVKTNIVTSIEISGRYDHESPLFPALVENTARNFTLESVSADKAYSSRKNLQLVTDKGATPYIPFKGGTLEPTEDSVWKKMYHFYHFNREAFLSHYHKRSNVESTFAMMKAKFGDRLRSKTDVAQANEMLLKVLAHNICVVIQSMYELGIEPTLWASDDSAHKVP
ncbi:MAG: transposase [Rubrobacter sp.]|nr:transposase [Rubrobacter sp.]